MSILIPYSRRDLYTVATFDLGTQAGWCDCREDSSFRSGALDFSAKKYPSLGKQYLAWRVALIQYKKRLESEGFKLGRVYYEDVLFQAQNGVQAAQRWGAWEGILLSFCESHEIPCIAVGTGAVKKAATGRGDAPKDLKRKEQINQKRAEKGRKLYDGPTVQEALTALGFKFETHDEADAQALMLHALELERKELAENGQL